MHDAETNLFNLRHTTAKCCWVHFDLNFSRLILFKEESQWIDSLVESKAVELFYTCIWSQEVSQLKLMWLLQFHMGSSCIHSMKLSTDYILLHTMTR